MWAGIIRYLPNVSNVTQIDLQVFSRLNNIIFRSSQRISRNNFHALFKKKRVSMILCICLISQWSWGSIFVLVEHFGKIEINLLMRNCCSVFYRTQVEVPSGSDLWSDRSNESNLWLDRPRPKCPLIRLKTARNNVCARSALEVVSEQTLPDWNDLWWDWKQTIAQTIVQPRHRPNPEHCPDDCLLKINSDQTIVRSKVFSWSNYCALDIASD